MPEKIRFGLVVAATRLLFGIDYDNKLLALHLGPIALCIAWGEPDSNPFTSPEQFDAWKKEQAKRNHDYQQEEQCTKNPNSCKHPYCDFPRCLIDEGRNE